jgi:hypothetical protein
MHKKNYILLGLLTLGSSLWGARQAPQELLVQLTEASATRLQTHAQSCGFTYPPPTATALLTLRKAAFSPTFIAESGAHDSTRSTLSLAKSTTKSSFVLARLACGPPNLPSEKSEWPTNFTSSTDSVNKAHSAQIEVELRLASSPTTIPDELQGFILHDPNLTMTHSSPYPPAARAPYIAAASGLADSSPMIPSPSAAQPRLSRSTAKNIVLLYIAASAVAVIGFWAWQLYKNRQQENRPLTAKKRVKKQGTRA